MSIQTETAAQARQNVQRLTNLWRMATGELRSPEVACTPHDVVLRMGTSELLHYRPRTAKQHPTPVLLVPSLVNRHWILDLTIDRSVVGLLLDQGFDVYLLDWGVPDAGNELTTLGEYILGRLHLAVEQVAGPSGHPVSLLGYCMGGTIALAYAALRPELVRNLILLATPVDLCDDGMLTQWSQSGHFDFSTLGDAFGLVDGDFLQNGFTLLKPTWPVRQLISLWQLAWNEDFIKRHLSMSKWVNSPIPVGGKAYAQWCNDIYRDNLLAKGEWRLAGEPVHLSKVTASTFNAIAEHDHLIPTESSTVLDQHLTGTADHKTVVFPCGHIGLSVGGAAAKRVWPEIGDWLVERSLNH